MRLLKPSYSLFLRTSERCQLGCKSCPAGRKEPDEQPDVGGVMRPELLSRALDYILKDAHVTSCVFHFYNEPSLIPWLGELIAEAKKRNIPSLVSTNLSCTPKMFANFVGALAAGVDNVIVSASGFTQAVYERSHKGGDIENVKRLMVDVAHIKQPHTFLRLGWHRYRYNQHEEPLMEAYCRHLGYHFTPYATSLLPLERALARFADGLPDRGAEDLIIPIAEAKPMCWERRGWRCMYQDNCLTIDADARLYSCSARMIDPTDARPCLFDVNLREYVKARYSHPTCVRCKAVGGHIYGRQQYGRSRWDLTRHLEDFYRNSGLNGYLPGFTRWAVNTFYTRPQKNK